MNKVRLLGFGIRLGGPLLTASWILLLNSVNAEATTIILVDYIEATILALFLRFGLDLRIISKDASQQDKQKLALLSALCGIAGTCGGFFYGNYFIAALGISQGIAILALLLRVDGKILAGDLLEYSLRPILLFLFAIYSIYAGDIDLVLITELHAALSFIVAAITVIYVFGYTFSGVLLLHHPKGARIDLNLYFIACFGAILARLDILLAEKVLLAEYANYYAVFSRAMIPLIAYVNSNYWYMLRGKSIQQSTSKRLKRFRVLGFILALQLVIILIAHQQGHLSFVLSSVIFCYLTYLVTVFSLGPSGLIHIEKFNGERRSKVMLIPLCLGIILYSLSDAGDMYFLGLSFSLNMLNYLLVEHLILVKEKAASVPGKVG